MRVDYCSLWPEGNWSDCCQIHDIQCTRAKINKSSWDRLQADYALRACVKAKGHPVMAEVMFYGVRAWALLKGGY